MIKDREQIALNFIKVYKKYNEKHLRSNRPDEGEAVRRKRIRYPGREKPG